MAFQNVQSRVGWEIILGGSEELGRPGFGGQRRTEIPKGQGKYQSLLSLCATIKRGSSEGSRVNHREESESQGPEPRVQVGQNS